MKLCKRCYVLMENVMRFEKGTGMKFYRCPKCFDETRHIKIDKNELFFDNEIRGGFNEQSNRWNNVVLLPK